MEIMRPLIAEAVNNTKPSVDLGAEVQKKANDNLMGMITNEVAKKIAEVKRFSGGGSGDRVKAGTGVTITTDVLGRRVINATGGGFNTETPVGTIDGSNNTFTVSNEPVQVVSDGITYFDGAGYTYSAGTITMDVGPSQYIRSIF
jgi:hypothetical protein